MLLVLAIGFRLIAYILLWFKGRRKPRKVQKVSNIVQSTQSAAALVATPAQADVV